MQDIIRRILMIDDDNEYYLIVKQMLMQAKRVKYDLHWADSFHSGLGQIQSDHFDAVLVDYDLGGRTGLEIIREANANDYQAPFILYTGRGSYEVDIEAMSAGATMYLTKDEVNPLLLERAIRYAIEIKQKERKLRENEAQLKNINDQLVKELVERKRAEQHILAEQAWLRITLASIGDAVITTDPKGLVTSLNSTAEHLTGWSSEEALGQPMEQVFSIINEITGQKLEDPVGEVMQSGLVVGLADRTALVARDGRVIPVEDSAAPIQNGDGEILGVVMVFRDVTEKRKNELALADYAERLKSSNQELEQFATIASHDLQEPLRKIKWFGDLLRDQLGEALGEVPEDYLERMNSAADRMQEMIRDLLELSRVNSQGRDFEMVDLTEAACDVVSDLETRILAEQGQVLIGPLPTIDGDAVQIRGLLQNLIGNAVKYHKPGVPPIVKVSVLADPEKFGDAVTVSIQIEDNGIGFEEVHIERIFQPFQRLHGRGEYEGTGIGLSICKKIVERHQGRITAHGWLGNGSTFIVTLPLKQTI
jgi:PAS domain S-box-containing protein